MKQEDFNKMLDRYLEEKREKMKTQWNRILPTNELLFDRWEKAKMLKTDENSSVYDTSVIMGDVKIGRNVWVGPFTVIEGINGNIEIGDNCNISSGVQIFTHDSVKRVLSGGKEELETGDVYIGRNTYIGGLTIITKGVSIGNYCVIGANSLVNKDIPDYSIAFGNPAKVKGRVDFKDGNINFVYF
ncbi:acyltransferase [Oceanotoga teriensis]|uniref:acyltransferase n=1 Tax=Oceanotoga teriensis TaxID=515440 RepID=UPI0027134937|nr:acyltransferase [Oceanotoga teriensis]MDO7976077.1 acyltransferase [Oceanotoga teriensis]